jgi:hypothetical protein
LIRASTFAAALTSLFATAAHAAAPVQDSKPAQVDAELLEFLGSIDTEEEGWQEYLEQKPVKPVAAKASPGKPAPPADKPDPKQVKAK